MIKYSVFYIYIFSSSSLEVEPAMPKSPSNYTGKEKITPDVSLPHSFPFIEVSLMQDISDRILVL